MKRIITLIILMLLIKGIAFCQEIEYYEHDEYEHDSTGVYILIENPEYKLISTINESSWGIKNREGDIVIPLGKYQLLVPIDEGMIIAQKDGKAGVIDITEKTLIPFIYDKIGAFSNCTDLAPVIKNKKQGFINRKGEIIIPLEYDTDFYSAYFREPGLAILMKKGKLVTLQNNTWSYFDLKGKLIHKNIPIDEIMKNYGNRFAWGEPSNEKQGFDIKQANKEDY